MNYYVFVNQTRAITSKKSYKFLLEGEIKSNRYILEDKNVKLNRYSLKGWSVQRNEREVIR